MVQISRGTKYLLKKIFIKNDNREKKKCTNGEIFVDFLRVEIFVTEKTIYRTVRKGTSFQKKAIVNWSKTLHAKIWDTTTV